MLTLAAALLLTGCTDGAEDATRDQDTSATPSPTLGPRDVNCPGDVAAISAPLSGLGESAALEAYLLDPEESDDDEDTSGTYCLQVALLDAISSEPTEVTIEAPQDGSSYGESYTTSDTDGTEEITYFPYAVGVYGGCRRVTATLTLADGSVHDARMRIGTGCPGDG